MHLTEILSAYSKHAGKFLHSGCQLTVILSNMTAHLNHVIMCNPSQTRMWANAQRHGRHAEYRWRSLLNAAVWLTPTTRVHLAKFHYGARAPENVYSVLAQETDKHRAVWLASTV